MGGAMVSVCLGRAKPAAPRWHSLCRTAAARRRAAACAPTLHRAARSPETNQHPGSGRRRQVSVRDAARLCTAPSRPAAHGRRQHGDCPSPRFPPLLRQGRRAQRAAPAGFPALAQRDWLSRGLCLGAGPAQLRAGADRWRGPAGRAGRRRVAPPRLLPAQGACCSQPWACGQPPTVPQPAHQPPLRAACPPRRCLQRWSGGSAGSPAAGASRRGRCGATCYRRREAWRTCTGAELPLPRGGRSVPS